MQVVYGTIEGQTGYWLSTNGCITLTYEGIQYVMIDNVPGYYYFKDSMLSDDTLLYYENIEGKTAYYYVESGMYTKKSVVIKQDLGDGKKTYYVQNGI